MKGWGKFYNQMDLRKKASVAILISSKIDFKIKSIKRDKEGHFIFVTEINHSISSTH